MLAKIRRDDGVELKVGRSYGYRGGRWTLRAIWKTTEGLDASITRHIDHKREDRCIVPVGELEELEWRGRAVVRAGQSVGEGSGADAGELPPAAGRLERRPQSPSPVRET